MDTTPCTRILIVIAVLVASMVWTLAESKAATDQANTTQPRTPTQRQVVDWARSRFAAAGLTFPEVEITFHPDSRDCEGSVGLYRHATRSLEMCRVDTNTMLHELAHTWANNHLSDHQRDGFTAHRGLRAWNDHALEWEERATEHFAEMMVWALMDRDITITWVEHGHTTRRLLTIPKSQPHQLAAAYQLIIGNPPPNQNEEALAALDTFASE